MDKKIAAKEKELERKRKIQARLERNKQADKIDLEDIELDIPARCIAKMER